MPTQAINPNRARQDAWIADCVRQNAARARTSVDRRGIRDRGDYLRTNLRSAFDKIATVGLTADEFTALHSAFADKANVLRLGFRAR
jgi:hypothetical protein